MLCLSAVLNVPASSLTVVEQNFISKVYMEDTNNNSTVVHDWRQSFANSESPDFVENVTTSPVWKCIENLMGPEAFSNMWTSKLVYYELSDQCYLALNSKMRPPRTVYLRRGTTAKAIINYKRVRRCGYNPAVIIDRKAIMRRRALSGYRLIVSNHEALCKLIDSQDTGIACPEVCNTIPIHLIKLLKKFTKQTFKIKLFRKKLVDKLAGSQQMCVEPSVVCSFLEDVLDTYVPRGLIGSKNYFVKMKRNICSCALTNPQRPFKLKSLMKGLPVYKFPMNVFLCRFVVFLVQIFVIQLLSRLFYVTETLQGKRLLFIPKRIWSKYENKALSKLISSEVLKSADKHPWNQHTSKMSINYKRNGFRPIVFPSVHHKMTKNRLVICNAFLKLVVSQLNPNYGRILSKLHAQWSKLKPIKGERIYFVRSDVSDAFLSVHHEKITEILNRRLTAMGPVQTCRMFEYESNGRKRTVMHFTKFVPQLLKGKVFCLAWKKVFPTSYLKAVILQYIKHNFVTLDGKVVFHHCKGVPQGCFLSSILCELYLSDMDDHYFGHLKGENDLLIRATDDYLYITSDRGKALQFHNLIYTGIDEYGIKFQSSKTLTNLMCPITCFRFFGFILEPKYRKILPDFSEWTDIDSRISLHSRMSWADLTYRMKMICYVKLDRLVLDSNYLHKFAIFKNVFACSKIHAAKYKVIYAFLLENCEQQPTFEATFQPIISAADMIAKRTVSFNRGKTVVTFLDIKVIVLKAFAAELQMKEPFADIVLNLNKIANRILSTRRVSTRSKKLIKSLVKSRPTDF